MNCDQGTAEPRIGAKLHTLACLAFLPGLTLSLVLFYASVFSNCVHPEIIKVLEHNI